jgi:hypothetical protein
MLAQKEGIQEQAVGSVPTAPEIRIVCKKHHPAIAKFTYD